MKLSAVSAKSHRVTVDFGDDDTVWVEFSPQSITPALIAQMSDAETSGNAGAYALRLAEMLCQIVSAWDFQEDDGTTMVPLTVDRVSQMPISVLGAVIASTRETVTVGEPKPATSDGI